MKLGLCTGQDGTVLHNDEQRWCVAHKEACSLPGTIDAFGAGFSCTSYSLLNKDATKNATAMDKAMKNKDDPEELWFRFGLVVEQNNSNM